MNVAVNQLTLRGACDAPHHQAFLIEDALNTQLSGESRLVLVRTLSLLPLGGQDKQQRDSRFQVADRVAGGWSRVMAAAMHGSSDSAGSANSVWFHDTAEAKAILLARLIKGQSVNAWFWTLAVKLWQGQTLAKWIADELLADPPIHDRSEAANLLAQLIAAGEVKAAEAALTHYLRMEAGSGGVLTGGWFNEPISVVEKHKPRGAAGKSDAAETPETKMLQAVTARLRATLPIALFQILRSIARQTPIRSPLVELAATYVAGVLPELRLRPKLLHNIAQHFLDDRSEIFVSDNELRTPAIDEQQPQRADKVTDLSVVGDIDRAPVKLRDSKISPEAAITQPRTTTPSGNAPEVPITQPAAFVQLSEQISGAAGLFFLLNVLRELDWPGWLAARPEWLAGNPTAHLLRHIAAHHRTHPADPVFAYLDMHIGEQPLLDPDLMKLWRIAIDRWLVRHTRIKLAKLVGRRGWLSWRDDRLDVRFGLQEIDMRLRRLALDRDPGWTPWAGMTLRFHFSDTPLLGDGLQ